MISTRVPDEQRLAEIFASLAGAPFSYPEVGATRAEFPRGYNADRYAASLGHGDAVFESAKQAIRDWVPFELPWVRVFAQAEPAEGVMAAVVARVFGLWWTNLSRVIYTIDEADRFGFAYGTLPDHAEIGEEVFLVERSGERAEVRYTIQAFSRPRHLLARVGYPLSRAAQRRFGAGSIAAMQRATRAATS